MNKLLPLLLLCGCFEPGEDLVLTEKIHGSNGRFAYHDGRFWVGSRNCMLFPGDNDVWNEVAGLTQMKERLQNVLPGHIVFGEVYGRTQRGDGYDYGLGILAGFVVFDIYDISAGRYLDYVDMMEQARKIDLPTVPELDRVIWNGLDALLFYANGPAVLGVNANHVREGFVVRPLQERYHPKLGRVILKLHGEDFLLGKQLKRKG